MFYFLLQYLSLFIHWIHLAEQSVRKREGRGREKGFPAGQPGDLQAVWGRQREGGGGRGRGREGGREGEGGGH